MIQLIRDLSKTCLIFGVLMLQALFFPLPFNNPTVKLLVAILLHLLISAKKLLRATSLWQMRTMTETSRMGHRLEANQGRIYASLRVDSTQTA